MHQKSDIKLKPGVGTVHEKIEKKKKSRNYRKHRERKDSQTGVGEVTVRVKGWGARAGFSRAEFHDKKFFACAPCGRSAGRGACRTG